MVLVNKLKRLKKVLILWKTERFKRFSEKVLTSKSSMDEVQRQLQAQPLRNDLVFKEKEVFKTYSKLARYFFKSAWSVVGDDFVAVITIFFKTGKLLKEVNSTLITLVAKCDNASNVFDFRPMFCCNVIYKCLTKKISSRMKFILKGLISSSQFAFISGRSIQDNILLAHEIVRNYHKSGGSPRCALKIDLQKAYDTVSWDAIAVVMRKFGFPERFFDWVMQQVLAGNYGLHPKCKGTNLTHLCFADDILVFFKGNVKSA
ncbi:uncharacterized protein LOC113343248 [Papaver somniferum]|uniref:uncharacterized protein LOC113343248 n=1 Tax=Papaver somniferum TaxID=3469 RepID=UPI000E6FE843|nr:uncharacterized protein LOC113343248 [Papaver somniferum]